MLVLDEVQWADDPERGSAWTRLLLAGDYRHILLLGALDAEPLVLHAFPDAEIKVFERILPLEFVGERALRGLTPGTVVVAFSRKAVLALAGEINRLHPSRVSVLYGAMPLSSRREEIDRFLGGASDVTVATDVLGHGVNLPCETLLFAETTKFDGESRRDLLPWELAQIAGRAGRFGLVERGHVGVLTGRAVGECRPGDRRGGAAAARAASRPGISATASSTRRGSGRVSPISASTTHGASTPRSPPGIASRRATWAYESWLAVESLGPLRGRLAAIQRRLVERNRRLTLEDTWKLINAPVDEDNAELLATLALAVSGDTAQRSLLDVPARPRAPARCDARRGRASWTNCKHPALVRAAVSRASAASRSSAPLRSRRLLRHASLRASTSRCRIRRSAAAARAAGRARRGSRCVTAASAAR